MAKQGNRLDEIRVRPKIENVIVFLHGFLGDKDETWDRFTWILKAEENLHEWDILSFGYSTSLRPDIAGVWSADPDLPILSLHLRTRLEEMEPFSRYSGLVIVAHSMGGLIVQRALLDDSNLAGRTKGLFLFGTPSAGLKKAGLFSFLKPQLRNMNSDSDFIRSLRRDWDGLYRNGTPFKFLSIAVEDIIDQVLDMATPHYRRIWSTCSTNEKVFLFRLAQEGFVNWQMKRTLRSLIRRRFVVAAPNFRLMNESFRRFVLRAERPEVFQEWEKAVEASMWSRIKMPIIFSVIALAVFFFVTQGEAFHQSLGIFAALLAGAPALIRVIGTLMQQRQTTSDQG